ncbi:MAG: rhodanese-like domain-containing protein [Bacteroidales bacterium]
MNSRVKISVVLLLSSALLAVIPLPGKNSLISTPEEVLSTSINESGFLTPDQVASLIARSDSTFQLIDVRTQQEFNLSSIPGAINLPLSDLLKSGILSVLPGDNIRKIFYSNGDLEANLALVAVAGYGLKNVAVMKGGLNCWFENIMLSSFSGDKITPEQNALFETRYKARRLFTEINSLPDSLKNKGLDARKFNRKKLDGGCE